MRDVRSEPIPEPAISLPAEKIAEFCQRNRIRRLALFGSVIRTDFAPDSDLDVLVEFEPGHPIGLMGMARLESELTALIGRKVDLREAGELSRCFRAQVLANARPVYESGLTTRAFATCSKPAGGVCATSLDGRARI